MKKSLIISSAVYLLASVAASGAMAQTGLDDLVIPPSSELPLDQDSETDIATGAAQPTHADSSFDAALRSLMPMSPQQVEDFRRHHEDMERAEHLPLMDLKPVSRSIDLSLQPGEVAPVIRLAGGNVSTITFSDRTGQPWPVMSVTTGNPQAYVAQSAGAPEESNIIVISPLTYYGKSNMVVTLMGHPVPIILTLESGTQEIDYRVDVRINERGPNARYDIVGASTLPATGDSVMLSFLDGVPPSDAQRLNTRRAGVEAWRYDDMLYVRTEREMLSPAYISRSSNVSGVNVYVLVDSPVLILSKDGKMETVHIGQ